MKKDQEVHQHLIKLENIKNVKASNHLNLNILKKYLNFTSKLKLNHIDIEFEIKRCFIGWKKYTRSEILVKEAEIEKQKTKLKMTKFLEAITKAPPLHLENLPLTSRSNKSNQSSNHLQRSKSFESKLIFNFT